jgi:hypothetical protein
LDLLERVVIDIIIVIIIILGHVLCSPILPLLASPPPDGYRDHHGHGHPNSAAKPSRDQPNTLVAPRYYHGDKVAVLARWWW